MHAALDIVYIIAKAKNGLLVIITKLQGDLHLDIAVSALKADYVGDLLLFLVEIRDIGTDPIRLVIGSFDGFFGTIVTKIDCETGIQICCLM